VREKKHLGFAALRAMVSSQEGKVAHKVHDAVMSGLAMMFFQDPSLLQFQKRMEEVKQTSNLKTLFGVSSVPKETCMRKVLDEIPSELLTPVFRDFFHELQRSKGLEPYRVTSLQRSSTVPAVS
jgi:hypothetical protein